MAAAKKQAYRLLCNLKRGDEFLAAGTVVGDFTGEELDDLAGMVEPVGGKAAAAGDAANVVSIVADDLTEEQVATCSEINSVMTEVGLSESEAIKSVKRSNPDLPGVAKIRSWLKAWRAQPLAAAGDAADQGGTDGEAA